jgi:hypothetical protein
MNKIDKFSHLPYVALYLNQIIRMRKTNSIGIQSNNNFKFFQTYFWEA